MLNKNYKEYWKQQCITELETISILRTNMKWIFYNLYTQVNSIITITHYDQLWKYKKKFLIADKIN